MLLVSSPTRGSKTVNFLLIRVHFCSFLSYFVYQDSFGAFLRCPAAGVESTSSVFVDTYNNLEGTPACFEGACSVF